VVPELPAAPGAWLTPHVRSRLIPVLVVSGLLAACGGTVEDSSPSTTVGDVSGVPTTAAAPAPGPVEGVDLAGIRMEDLTGGGEVSLAEAFEAPAGQPVLAFFWAPFCSTCRSEAPVLEDLAAEAPAGLRVVGVGALDDVSAAREFRTDTAVRSFPLLWSEDTDSWAAFEVPAQPYLLLVRDGKVVQRWPGGASADEIRNAVAA